MRGFGRFLLAVFVVFAADGSGANEICDDDPSLAGLSNHVRAKICRSPLSKDPIFRRQLEVGLEAARTVLNEVPEGSRSAIRERVQFGEFDVSSTSVVSLRNTPDANATESFVCTGVLIHPKAILTAAHCFCNSSPDRVREPQVSTAVFISKTGKKKSVDVIAIDTLPAVSPKVIGDSEFDYCSQKSFSGDRRRYSEGDLALAIIDSNEAPSFAKIVSIATNSQIDQAKLGYVVGFGVDEHGVAGDRKGALVPIATTDCVGEGAEKARFDEYDCLAGRELVASDRSFASTDDNPDACRGDSGGPLFVDKPRGPDDDEVDQQVMAIVSRSIIKSDECGLGTVYVRVSGNAREWVEKSLSRL